MRFAHIPAVRDAIGVAARRRERRVLGSASTLLAGAALAPILLGVLADPLQRELAFGPVGLGTAAAAFWAVAAVVAPVAGRSADRVGWRRATVLAAVVSAVTLLAVAVVVHTTAALFATMALSGLAYGLASPTSNLALAREMPLCRRGLAFGLKQAAVPVASMAAGLALPVFAITLGWRSVYLMAAAVPMAAVVLATLGRRRGSLRRARTPTPSPEPVTVTGISEISASPTFPLISVTVAAGGATLATAALTAFSVTSLVGRGMPPGTAGIVVAGSAAAALLMRLVAGAVVDRRGWPPIVVAGWILGSGAIGVALMAVPNLAVTGIGVAVASAGVWGWPALVLVGIVNARPGDEGSATGLMQLGANTGSALGPFAFGLLFTATDLTLAWAVFAAVTAGAAAALVVLGRRRNRTERAQDPPTPEIAELGG